MAILKALGGTADILPEEAACWQEIEEKTRALFGLYGFREIRTPVIEEQELFLRSLGAQAEIVNKQMYKFTDQGNRQIVLRPEGTAPAVRAFLEHGFDKKGGLTRWYYLGPMFRAERPQAGRRRQFHQIGVEVFGSAAPYQDAEVVFLLRHLLLTLGVSGFQLKLNSLGCRNDRVGMVREIKETFSKIQGGLCQECQERLSRNPLRILDCKETDCVSRRTPVDVGRSVCSSCRSHFEAVLKGLAAAGLKQDTDYLLDSSLVRGLDYYTKTAFELIHTGLGAQNALGGGGRYDDLVGSLGGVATPAVGFAVGVERIIMALQAASSGGRGSSSICVFVAPIGEGSLPDGFRLLTQLRSAGISAVADQEGRPLKRQLEQANKLGCRYVAMLGEAERGKGIVTLKEMESGKQEEVAQGELAEKLNKCLPHP